MDVIFQLIAIIVIIVARNLTGIAPEIADQVRVIDVESAIDNGDDDFRGVVGQLPGFGGGDVDIWCCCPFCPLVCFLWGACVEKVPLLVQQWVIAENRILVKYVSIQS